MIGRTTLDLRIAAHQTTTATINASDWRHWQSPIAPLVALATRLDPAPARDVARRPAPIAA